MTDAPLARGDWLAARRAATVRIGVRTAALVRSAPATFGLITVIAVTSYLLSQAAPAEAHQMLLSRSTNLHQLLSLNFDVLVRSAFWLEDASELFPWVALFVLVLAPAERWLGTGRWLTVFVAGHIGATIATTTAIWLAITADLASQHLARGVDVGVSYGFFAVAAVISYRIPAHWRAVYLVLLILFPLSGAIGGFDFTDAGHLVAMGIGLALYPLARARRPLSPPPQRPAHSLRPGTR